MKEELFRVLDICAQSLPQTQFLLITNGRMFAYRDYSSRFAWHTKRRTVTAIALHSSLPEEHDYITRVKGSFAQTMEGIRNLLAFGARVEIRIVIQKTNCVGLLQLAQLISKEFPRTEQVSLMGLELLGSAARNRNEVWTDYRQVGPEIARAVRYLAQHGISARIYNLPLCFVDEGYWSLCAKSISDHKRTYTLQCADCKVIELCGGLFGTPMNHKLMTVKPVKGRAIPE